MQSFDQAVGPGGPVRESGTEHPGLARRNGSLVDGLIGRNREFAHIEHLLWAVRHGEAKAVALRGEPGVGKTALIHAGVARATDFSVVQLRGLADPVSPPREWPAPLADLLHRLLHRHNGTSTAPHLPSPTVPQRTNGSAPMAPVSTSPPPDGLVAQAADALVAIAQHARRPVLVTVDDAHRLPVDFANALGRAVTTGQVAAPVALVLAWRDLPHVEPFELGNPDLPEHILGPIDFDGAQDLLEQLHLRPPQWNVLKQLVRATAGNPFALLETYVNLSPDIRTGTRELPMPVPVGQAVASAFAECLEAFEGESRQVIGTAATGAPVSILLSTLRDLGLEAGAMQQAQSLGIVVVRNQRVDFRHPLVRAAAFELLPEERRDEIQMALARCFASRGYVERSAFHASQIHQHPSNEVSMLSGHAARVALDRGDPERAASYEEVASDFAESQEETGSHLGQACALWMSAGRGRRAIVCLERAERLRQVSPAVRGDLLYQRARAEFARSGHPSTIQTIEEAAELCVADTPHRAVLMLADAVAYRLFLDRPAGSVEVAKRALALARGVSSHTEILAEATLAVAELLETSEVAARRRLQSIAMLLGQAQGFPGSPYLAQLIGEGLMLDGYWTLATRWSTWIERCASTSGDKALGLVPPLLSATASLEDGRVDGARAQAQISSDLASSHGDIQLAGRALSLLTTAHAMAGNYAAGFESAARLFSLEGDTGRTGRVRSRVALALLELQRARPAAAVAWLRVALEEIRSPHPEPCGSVSCDTTGLACLPAIAEVLLLCRRDDDLAEVVQTVERSALSGRVLPILRDWVRAMGSPDLDNAVALFEATRRALHHTPLLTTRVELSWGVRLAIRSHHDEARPHLERARDAFHAHRAEGWAVLAEHELAQLPGRSAPAAGVRPSPEAGAKQDTERTEPLPAAHALWELDLLGSFTVRLDGKTVQLPLGLAAQGLKVVALRQRILAEELVELLWVEAAPGVGMRRLRNVLWRVRAACGDLLVREGNFITLAEGVRVDVDVFRHAAALALDRETPVGKAVQLAHEALRLYKGELLPGDRYADWSAGPRESLSRLQVELLEFLLTEALQGEEHAEAIILLNKLIDTDPYEEHYHLQLAELYARAGNRRRALGVLERADQMLDELGLPTSPALLRIRASISAAGNSSTGAELPS